MRILIQLVKNASVKVNEEIVSKIDNGELLFVGFTINDNKEIIDKMIDKLIKLRIFSDGNKTNVNLQQAGGKILAVSQFTLYASLVEGNRPSFTKCLNKDDASILFEYFKNKIKEVREDTEFGIFHADMEVNLTNDGPFTILLDSKELGYE